MFLTQQTLKSNLQALEQIQDDIDLLDEDSISAEEAANVGLKIADTFSRVINNVKTTITRPFKTNKFVRSEFTAFEKSYPTQIQSLMRNVDISKIETPVSTPENFITTYPKAIETVQDGFKTIDMARTISSFEDGLRALDKENIDTYHTLNKMLNKKQSEVMKITKKEAENMTKTMFDPKKWNRSKLKPAKDVFVSTSDLKRSHDMLKKWEVYHKQAVDLSKKLDDINDRVDKIVDNVVSLETVRKETISAIHDYLQAMAIQVDMYGAFIHHAQVIEHNYVIALKKLFKENT